ncbi:MAG: hypothetical protein ABIR14_02390, partial [Candidatus Paceibacterota bacterium]
MQLYYGRIKEVDEMKSSRNGGAFLRVYFQMKVPSPELKVGEPAPKQYFWAKTDLVPTYRNYKRWENLIKPGNVLKNIFLKTEDTVDADSFPELV